jgi:hypothetical protein
MKPKSENSQAVVKSVPIRGKRMRVVVAATAVLLALDVPAAVHVVRFDPPLSINAFTEPPENLFFNVSAFDLNVDGDVDFRLAYGYGAIGAYLNSPTRFGRREGRPGVAPMGGPVAAVPLGSIIGSNIVSSVNTNRFVWSPGYTNRYDLTQFLGNHEASVITANLTTHGFVQCPVFISTNGMLVTNCFDSGPVVSGDVARQEAVMALEFYVNGQPHYGYIHFDFRAPASTPLGGASGVIYGWAYETEPGDPIRADPLATARQRIEHKQHLGRADDRGRGHSPR